MNQLEIFKNEKFGEVRIIEINNEPWFIGKDVAECLGYKDTDQSIRKHVDDEDKLTRQINGSDQTREFKLINESGLYSLIMSSKLEKAKEFKKWVTSEVLPSIRKHGAYMTPQKIEEVLLNPDTIIQLAKNLKNEQEKNKELKNIIDSQKGKVLFADTVTESNTTILIGDLAKILKGKGYDTGQKRLFEKLRNEGYLIKQGSSKNMPTQYSMELGLFEVKESTHTNPDGSIRITKTTKVTGKGQIYFIEKFIGNKEEIA